VGCRSRYCSVAYKIFFEHFIIVHILQYVMIHTVCDVSAPQTCPVYFMKTSLLIEISFQMEIFTALWNATQWLLSVLTYIV